MSRPSFHRCPDAFGSRVARIATDNDEIEFLRLSDGEGGSEHLSTANPVLPGGWPLPVMEAIKVPGATLDKPPSFVAHAHSVLGRVAIQAFLNIPGELRAAFYA